MAKVKLCVFERRNTVSSLARGAEYSFVQLAHSMIEKAGKRDLEMSE